MTLLLLTNILKQAAMEESFSNQPLKVQDSPMSNPKSRRETLIIELCDEIDRLREKAAYYQHKYETIRQEKAALLSGLIKQNTQ